MISASSRSFFISSLLKSPSPSKYCHSKSSESIFPLPVLSCVNVKILPFVVDLFLSYCGLFVSNSVGW